MFTYIIITRIVVISIFFSAKVVTNPRTQLLEPFLLVSQLFSGFGQGSFLRGHNAAHRHCFFFLL